MNEMKYFLICISLISSFFVFGYSEGRDREKKDSAKKIAGIKSGYYKLKATTIEAPMVLEQVTPSGARVVNSMAYQPCRAHDGVSEGEVFILTYQEPSTGEDLKNPDCYLQIRKLAQQP